MTASRFDSFYATIAVTLRHLPSAKPRNSGQNGGKAGLPFKPWYFERE